MPPVALVDTQNAAAARASLLERSVRAAAPVLLPWFSEAVLRASLASELDHDLKASASQHSPSSSPPRNIDAVRLVRLAGEPPRWIIVHLHRQEVPRPFVHALVKHRSFELQTDADIELLTQAACAGFADEPVKRVCITRFESDVEPPPTSGELRTSFVAAPIRDLHPPAGRKPLPNLRLEPPDSLTFYNAYESWYHEFWRQRPELVSQVPIETREDLERCMADDGLRLLYLGDDLCGVLAAHRHVEFGLKGWRMREKVIAPAFWGRGLSAPATVLFARTLDSEPDDAIWGTIVPGNFTSMRSAEAIGRRTIGTQYWL